jgi:hypothetical protein
MKRVVVRMASDVKQRETTHTVPTGYVALESSESMSIVSLGLLLCTLVMFEGSVVQQDIFGSCLRLRNRNPKKYRTATISALKL